ncbi:hypothetical protein MON38_03245 [Hymenobacter sp. DH14]|uniref:DUF4384 domain-containing protein n=1 Tax=Hymenobacter cyanobacteriorum TaxID=2926463 RepID=A0A9X1VD89_9BACT|nr:hypothetical protein [Hymenobacter cyanobacteriorum]MCI1186420.1 hypothetical protein [Hymenobacter cyanobacteriorum]
MSLLPRVSLLIVLSWLLAVAVGQAQPTPYYFSLPDAAKAEPVTGAATSAWYVGRVLDARADRSRLGTVRRGLDNLPAPAMLTQSVPAAVLAFCRQQLPPRAGSRPVVLRLLTIEVGEDVRPTSENGEAEVVGEFLEVQPDSSFRVLLPVAESLRRGGMDVTLHHPANLGKLLTQALAKLAALPATASPVAPALSRADALAGRGGLPPYPVQTAAAAETGVYRNIDDFRANRLTAATRPFELKPTPRSLKGKLGQFDELEAYFLALSAEQPREYMPLTGLWGLSHGHTRYIVYQNRLYPLLPGPDGRSFTFTAQAPIDMAGSGSRALLGGLAGGAIGGAVAAGAGSRAGLTTFEVHLPTGRVVQQDAEARLINDGFVPDNPEAGKLYLFRRPDNVATEPLLVLLNGREVARLLPKQYVSLPAPDQHAELVLCLQRPTAAAATPEAAQLLQAPACLPVAPDRTGAVYIECVALPAAGQPPVLRIVPTRTGTAQVNQMRRAE